MKFRLHPVPKESVWILHWGMERFVLRSVQLEYVFAQTAGGTEDGCAHFWLEGDAETKFFRDGVTVLRG